MQNGARRWPCRGCGRLVHIFEDVCPVCGAYAPLQLPCAPVIRVAALCVAAIFFIRLTSVLGM